VHFPIVLLLLGASVAVAGVFINRWHLAWMAAGLLGLGAVGCFLAVKSGDTAKEGAGEPPPTVEALVDVHEKWAERTEIVGAVAAALGYWGGSTRHRFLPRGEEKRAGMKKARYTPMPAG